MALALSSLASECSGSRGFARKAGIENIRFPRRRYNSQQFTCSGVKTLAGPLLEPAAPRTQSFVPIVDDPDAPAGTWVHWVVYNLPASMRRLPERVPHGDAVTGGGKQGATIFPERLRRPLSLRR